MALPNALKTRRINPAWLVCWRYANGDTSSDMKNITFKSLYMDGNKTLRTPEPYIYD